MRVASIRKAFTDGVISIGLPPAGKFHIDLDPTALVFRNQSIQGTLVSSAQEIDETLEFARRGMIVTGGRP